MYQLLLLKLNLKIYLRSEWRAPPRCGGRPGALRAAPPDARAGAARGAGVRAAGGAGGRRRRGAARGRVAAWAEGAGGGAGGARAVFITRTLPPVARSSSGGRFQLPPFQPAVRPGPPRPTAEGSYRQFIRR